MATPQELRSQFDAVLDALLQLSNEYCPYGGEPIFSNKFGRTCNADHLYELHGQIKSSFEILEQLEFRMNPYEYSEDNDKDEDPKKLLYETVVCELKERLCKVTKSIERWGAKWTPEEGHSSAEQRVAEEEAKMNSLIEQFANVVVQKVVACKEEKCV